MKTLPSVNALWIGDTLNPIASACLVSFVNQGHIVNLYTYNPINNLPQNINICDGNQIIHHSKIIKHKKSGSYALFSDIFRYELLKHLNHGFYIDCDVYCLKPIYIPEHGYLFGYENGSIINGAILALPKDSELLLTLTNLANQDSFVPQWYSPYNKTRLKIKRLFGYARHISEMGWGVIGPSAITYYAKTLGVAKYAQPIEVLYPIQHHETHKLLDSNLTIDEVITKNSLCVHLYNETLKNIDFENLPNGCILSKMLGNIL